jgi:hypothetical protein
MYFYTFRKDASNLILSRVDLNTGAQDVKTTIPYVALDATITVAFKGTGNILFPFISASGSELNLIAVNRNSLLRFKHIQLSFPTTVTFNSVAVFADSTGNGYLQASGNNMFWVKLHTSTITPVRLQFWPPGNFDSFTVVGGGTYSDTMFHVAYGKFATANQDATMIFRQSQNDFTTYNCMEFLTLDATGVLSAYYPTITYDTLTTVAGTLSASTNIIQAVDNYPFLAESYLSKTNSPYSFRYADTLMMWGNVAVPSLFRGYPD